MLPKLDVISPVNFILRPNFDFAFKNGHRQTENELGLKKPDSGFFRTLLLCPSYFTDLAYKFENVAADEHGLFKWPIQVVIE